MEKLVSNDIQAEVSYKTIYIDLSAVEPKCNGFPVVEI